MVAFPAGQDKALETSLHYSIFSLSHADFPGKQFRKLKMRIIHGRLHGHITVSERRPQMC